jgi:hypothetical protein
MYFFIASQITLLIFFNKCMNKVSYSVHNKKSKMEENG